MTIKSSGALSISEIVTEFGGRAPHSLSEYRIGGSAGVTASTANNNIPTTNDDIMMSDFYGAEDAPAALTAADITLVARTYAVSALSESPGVPGTANINFMLRSDGDLNITWNGDVGPGSHDAVEWLNRANNLPDSAKAARVEVMTTRTSGAASGAPFGQWLRLNTSRQWSLSASGTSATSVIQLEFREFGLTTILKTVNITLQATGASG